MEIKGFLLFLSKPVVMKIESPQVFMEPRFAQYALEKEIPSDGQILVLLVPQKLPALLHGEETAVHRRQSEALG